MMACSSPVRDASDEPLFADYIPTPTYIDSIITDSVFSFLPQDTFPFVETGWQKVSPQQTELKTSNVYDLHDTEEFRLDSFRYALCRPDTLAYKSYISYLSHPEPVKAGELRSTGAARENIKYLDVEQGLASSNVNCIAEDQFGVLWFGMNSGLTRYDGNYLFHYTKEHGLASNVITEIFVDSKQNMWIVSKDGLMKYDGKKLEILNKDSGLPTSEVNSIMEDQEGNIWFASGGVIKYDGSKLYHYNDSNGLNTNSVSSLGITGSQKIFIANFANRPQYLDGDSICSFPDNGRNYWHYGSNIINEALNDGRGNLWLVNYNATVARLYGDTASTVYRTWGIGLHHYSIDDILLDSRGNIWLGSIEAGIYKFGYNKLEAVTTAQGLKSNQVTDLFEDRHGNIWISTVGGGVNRMVPNSFRSHTAEEGFSAKAVYNMHVDQHKNLLMGTWADGMYSYDGTHVFKHRDQLEECIVTAFKEDSFGNLLVGAHQFGIYYFKPSDNDTVLYDSLQNWLRIPGMHIWTIRGFELDAEGNVWIFDDSAGAFRVLLSKDKTHYETIESYPEASGFVTINIMYSASQANGSIWVTDSKSGMSRIKGNTIEHFTKKNGLLSNLVVALYTDQDDRLFVGTAEGLQIFENETFKSITTKDGLSSNSIRSIYQDFKGRFWIGTAKGLNLLEKDDSKGCGYAISTFSSQDGLPSNEFLSNSVQMDSNKVMWWGTRNGLISLDLVLFEKKNAIPRVEISAINLLDQHVNFQGLLDSQRLQKEFYLPDSVMELSDVRCAELIPYFTYPKTLALPHDINTITLHFSAQSNVSSSQVYYQYRLIGYQESWSPESRSTEAKYANLPPGDYTFEVKAGIHNKEWGEVKSYSFVIKPPFTQTWWFRILAIALIVFVIYLIFKWRNRALLERQRQLESTVKERTQEIQHQKTVIEEKQVEILDSINYAQRIQRSLLATDELLSANLGDYFVFFQPKDIVSGDFYWARKIDSAFLLLTADSTGHGVPGAIMSMLNISCVEKAIESEKEKEPAGILNATRKKIIETLAKDGSAGGGKDGMDCSLIRFDLPNKQLIYAAANNAMWIVRGKELLEFDADKMPVGKHDRDKLPFNQTTVPLQKGDLVYTFTDGFADQFGGSKGKKFKYKTLKELLVKLSSLPLSEQRARLEEAFAQWKGELEQVDDVCIIGVRI